MVGDCIIDQGELTVGVTLMVGITRAGRAADDEAAAAAAAEEALLLRRPYIAVAAAAGPLAFG